MQDVADRAGVSRARVSLVMRDSPRVSERSRAAVLAAAAELRYRPNLMARNLASRRTMTIGLVLSDLHNPFYAETTDGIHRAATEAGYRIVINTGLRSVAGEQDAVDTFLQLRTDGVIMVGPWLPDCRLERLARETSLVVVGRTPETDGFDTVNVDDRLGARLVVDHLVGLGHARIAHIDGGGGAGAAQRKAGYEAAMVDHGLAEHRRVVAGEFTEAAGVRGVEELLADGLRPTAIFAANDLMATGALDQLEGVGLRVPEDVSLVGFDNTALAALRHIGLTTVNQPSEILGRLAAQCLIERLDGGRVDPVHHVLAPALVRRATSASPAPR
jgi:DNA-binding LacI/PurR family transcriptional regulator